MPRERSRGAEKDQSMRRESLLGLCLLGTFVCSATAFTTPGACVGTPWSSKLAVCPTWSRAVTLPPRSRIPRIYPIHVQRSLHLETSAFVCEKETACMYVCVNMYTNTYICTYTCKFIHTFISSKHIYLCIMYALTCTRYEHNYMLYVHRKFSGLQMTASADENTERNMAKKGIKEARECIQETVCETRRSPEIFVREKKTWSSKILCRYTSERAGTKSERSGVDRYPEILIKRARGIRGRYEQQLML